MDRNREARRATNMAAPSNGLSSSRRRHRSSSLRDSPDEDGGAELQEPGRLRDRGVVKKDRVDRDRDRERERERSNRSKRRRENRMLIHHVTTGSNREDGDDTSSESVNDEEEDDDDAGNGAGLRMLPPPPANPSTAAAAAMTSNHHNNHNPYSQHLHHRKSFPSSGNKVFRASPGAPPPAWKAADEMIGVSVPRKARSASTKRSHEWSSGGAVVGGGGATDAIHRQSSTSPVRLGSSAASPSSLAPPSPSSSNASVRKKMKANGGSKPRPPKSSSKSSSSNPEELEIEIAEVLYGLMTQSQAPSKKEIPSNDSNETKSKVSSPISNSTSLSTVAPKRKRPRQVSENPFGVRNSPVSSSMKTEIDHHQHHQSPKTDISSSYLENSSPASAVAAENGVSSFGFTTLPGHQASPVPSSEPPVPVPPAPAEEEGKSGVGVVSTKAEAEKESPAAWSNDGKNNTEAVITTAPSTTTTDLKLANPETEIQKEEKIEIDLMAPPPQQRTQEIDANVDVFNHIQMVTQGDDKLKNGKEEPVILTDELQKSNVQESGESSKQATNLKLRIDFEKLNKDTSNKSLHQALKHQHLSTKSETNTEKTAQPSSLPIPVSVPSWPPLGYVAPLQGVISMDGSTMPSTPIQPLFTHPRPKRCATHCYIARNIHYLQQFMKINPFWPAASGSAAPMFGAKHSAPNVIPSTELHAPSMQEKGQSVGIFPGQTTGKDTKSSQTTPVSDPTHRKQQVLLQQAVAPSNILHGPAFIFPFNQQQTVTASASASVRPGSSKLSSSTAAGGLGAASSAVASSSTTAAAAPALSFNYPNMGANETQYLAIVQNHPYAFPMPAVGAPPNYRGNHPNAQAMPLFNGSFYSSQMIHPSQIPQPQPPHPAPAPPQSQLTHQNSGGSTSSSQKHLQAQQRQQGTGAANGGGSGNSGGLHNSYKSRSQQPSPHMNPPAQPRHLENEVAGGEDSPSTADSRVSRAATNTMSVYGHNFGMPVQSQNFALMNHQAASATSNDKKQQQQSQQQMLKRVGADSSSSSLPPQTFAMSFAPMNGTTQNHTIFQSLPESSRLSYPHMMMTSPAVSAHHSELKKDFRTPEEANRTTGPDSSNADDDRKGGAGLPAKSGQSIAFSRPDLSTDASGSSSSAVISGTSNRSTRGSISTSVAAAQSSHHLQILQLQKQQQQQHVNARSKIQSSSSNGSGYPDHLITSSSPMAAMFSTSLTTSPVQSQPQWRNQVSSVRGPTASQASTTTSSLKNPHQPQQQPPNRSHPQSHTQISFAASAAAGQKLQSVTAAQMQLPTQQQQQQNQNPSSNSGSPTSSLSSSQPPKSTLVGTQRSSPSILGNPHNSNATKSQQQQQQQQLHKHSLQQQQQAQSKAYAQMMFTQPYIVQQPQAQQHSGGSAAASGYYLPRKQQASSSAAMLTLANTTTSDPAKAIAAATSNIKGASQQGIVHAAQYGGSSAAVPPSSLPAGFPPYVHNAPAAAVQVKPAEQKQPAGE